MAKKRKRKSRNKSAQSAAALRLNGLRAFQGNDNNQAIKTWERVPQAYRPTPALAEAYFRRGLERFYGSTSHSREGLADFQKASELQPQDPCYACHLGSASHHLGDLDQAVQAYRTTRQKAGPYADRTAYPLALALFQQEQDPAADPVWADLSAEEQVMLQEAGAFHCRPYQLSPEAPQLWHTLAALDAGDLPTAQAGLNELSAATKTERSILHYYRGILSAHREEWESARREWLAAYSSGLRSQRLTDNLAEVFHRAAEDFLSNGDLQTALAAAQESARHKSGDNSLNTLMAQIHQHLGFDAASANHWDDAQSHGQPAVKLDSGSFRLAYNLALSYERSENYLKAGEAWRETLRRRPRRADHPDALTDEQVARLWQRAAEAYRKAGQFDEASRVYQQAVKWSPNNFDLRLAMAEGLLFEGRVQAAQNELDRILERNPDHVPTLIQMGEVFFHNEYWWVKAGAPRYWERALKLQPDNPQARQALAEWYLDQAEIDYSWDRFEDAIENYQKSLEYQPRDARILSSIANCFIHLDELEPAREYSNRAFERANDNLDVLNEILSGWISTDNPEQAWEVMRQFESQNSAIPGLFYLAQAVKWLGKDDKEDALLWLERAIAEADPDEPILLLVGERVLDYDDALARQYLEQAIAAEQMPGQAHLLLSHLEDGLGNTRSSRKHLAEAERIAWKTKDRDLAGKIEIARIMSGGPQAFMERLMEMGGPALVEDFLDNFGDEFNEDKF